MKKEPQIQHPKVVARYKDYEITKSETLGMYYGFQGSQHIGHNEQLSQVISIISLREGEGFDINKVEIC
ncbi:hypothetical protein [Sulfuricurvum sp.]|uniref:hypothetical protein n=1 Tax=Sulfuricurvum sp. TaxID=2025608 RepID=UPI002636B4DD|nr:hypothetical protein [Sulfuricurvum sp.]MDD2267489.1 hypothetical protein [Sulfuricurvum sp.]MDD2783963.1 hypothetical protein [Sulfuricurvum sp.]